MKKLLIAAAVATAFIGINAQAASTGTINFTGSLTDSTCDVNVANQGSDATISLSNLATSSLPSLGSTAGDTDFAMVLTNCTLAAGETAVSASFAGGTTAVNTNGRLINKSTATTISNVTLELLDRTNGVANPIVIGSSSQALSNEYGNINTTNGTANLNYAVRYYAENGAATSGAVEGSVVYSLQYK